MPERKRRRRGDDAASDTASVATSNSKRGKAAKRARRANTKGDPRAPPAPQRIQLCISPQDKSGVVTITNKGLTARCSKGYRMARCSHGVDKGDWYIEFVVEESSKEGSHFRLGWSTSKGELQAPVGYDAHSYAYRDVNGAKVHSSCRHYYGSPYKPGDVIGAFIHLPDVPTGTFAPPPTPARPTPATPARQATPASAATSHPSTGAPAADVASNGAAPGAGADAGVGASSGSTLVATSAAAAGDAEMGTNGSTSAGTSGSGEPGDAQAPPDTTAKAGTQASTGGGSTEGHGNNDDDDDDDDESMRTPTSGDDESKDGDVGGFIRFFKNGVDQGVAFVNIPTGIPYYPAVSAFQGGVVTINPSPQLKCAVHPDNVAAFKRVRYFSELVPPPADAESGSLPRSNQTRSSRAVS